ncbi:MAG: hypothetical protein N3B18_09440 [Desulfobacterota bacterium]|nr:hypothetical protein [Thermodesulfobacteriota bacterium]
MILKTITVTTYDGYTGSERPVTFVVNGQKHVVTDIIDRWYEGSQEPGKLQLKYFKVKTASGAVYLLRYNSLFDAWALVIPGVSQDDSYNP